MSSTPDRTMDWTALLQDCARYVQDNENTAAFSPNSPGKKLHSRILYAISLMVPDPNDSHPLSLVWVTREELGELSRLKAGLERIRDAAHEQPEDQVTNWIEKEAAQLLSSGLSGAGGVMP